MNVERNAPCPCGSGKKYKKCCMAKDGPLSTRTAMVLFALLMLGGVIGIIVSMTFASAGHPGPVAWNGAQHISPHVPRQRWQEKTGESVARTNNQ